MHYDQCNQNVKDQLAVILAGVKPIPDHCDRERLKDLEHHAMPVHTVSKKRGTY